MSTVQSKDGCPTCGQAQGRPHVVVKTPEQWCGDLGVRILDPDGWRGAGGRPWTDPIDESEFRERLRVCTIDARGAKYLDGGAA